MEVGSFNKYILSRGGEEEGSESGQGDEDGQKRKPGGLFFAVLYDHTGKTCQNKIHILFVK